MALLAASPLLRQGAGQGVPHRAEVQEHQGAVGAAGQVGGLDVPVHHGGREPVEPAQHGQDALEHLQDPGGVVAMLLQLGLEIGPVHVLEHQDQALLPPRAQGEVVQEGGHLGVVELGQHPGLPPGQLPGLGLQAGEEDLLEGHGLARGLIPGQPGGGEGAGAQLPLQQPGASLGRDQAGILLTGGAGVLGGGGVTAAGAEDGHGAGRIAEGRNGLVLAVGVRHDGPCSMRESEEGVLPGWPGGWV